MSDRFPTGPFRTYPPDTPRVTLPVPEIERMTQRARREAIKECIAAVEERLRALLEKEEP